MFTGLPKEEESSEISTKFSTLEKLLIEYKHTIENQKLKLFETWIDEIEETLLSEQVVTTDLTQMESQRNQFFVSR